MAAVSASDIFAVTTGRSDHSARNVWQIRIRYIHSVGVDYNIMKVTNTIYKGILSLFRKSLSSSSQSSKIFPVATTRSDLELRLRRILGTATFHRAVTQVFSFEGLLAIRDFTCYILEENKIKK